MVYNLKKIETAKKMLAKKMPIDVIIEITGLSKEEIENIKNWSVSGDGSNWHTDIVNSVLIVFSL